MEKQIKKRSPKSKNTTKKKCGRPPVMTKETIAKLEYAFSMGLPDEQACLYAEIDPATLYRYQERNPDFCDRKVILKQSITMRARLNVAKEIAS